MITIFCHFSQFSAKKLAFFLNTNVMINFFQKFSFVLSQKRQFFRKIFRQKYLKNHNIGPWSPWCGKKWRRQVERGDAHLKHRSWPPISPTLQIDCLLSIWNRVARWFTFLPKIPIWVYFWRASELQMLVRLMTIWSSFQPFLIFNGHLEYMLCMLSFGIFPPFWYVWTKKNLANLL
jgi:hypothetical protein